MMKTFHGGSFRKTLKKDLCCLDSPLKKDGAYDKNYSIAAQTITAYGNFRIKNMAAVLCRMGSSG